MTKKLVNKDRRRIVQGFSTVAATIALPHRLSAQTNNDTEVLIIGGGGCGKTTLMQVVVVPTLQTFFSRVVLTAPSNRAARGFHPSAKTLHSIAGMKPQDSMRTSSLALKAIRCASVWTPTRRMLALGCMTRPYKLRRHSCMQLL